MPHTPRSAPGWRVPSFVELGLVVLVALVAIAQGGCAYEVIPLDDAPPAIPTLPDPLPFTIALGVQSFEGKLIQQDDFVAELARRIKGAQIFEGVIYPVPAGFETTWEFKLAIKEQAMEGPYNGLKSAVASFFSPLGFFIHMQTDYQVVLEGQLLRKKQLVSSYPVAGKLRYRYQVNTDGRKLEADVKSAALERTTRLLLAAIAADAEHIRREERARAGR